MAGFTRAQLEEIKARIDLGELVASYGYHVRRSGSSLKCCCPFHHEKTPSFVINQNEGYYHCFGCGVSGTAFTFVAREEGLTFVEAVKKLAEKTGVKLEYRADPDEGLRTRLYAIMAEAAQFYRRCLLKTAEAAKAREYLVERALDGETAEKYLIGYAPKGMPVMKKWAEKYGFAIGELAAAGLVKAPESATDSGYNRFGGRLMFTIADRQGRAVAFSGRQLEENKHSGKYVNSPETPIFKKSQVLFGFDKAAGPIAKDAHREVIVCEGQIDCIRLHISGFANAVASQGTAFTREHALMLKRVADTALLCFDDDDAGHKATIRTASILMQEDIPVRVASLPDGDDPDSFLRRHGAEAFRKMIEDKAESIVSFQVRTAKAKETHPESIDAVNRVTKAIISTLASCKNAVLKATLTEEAARLLKLPVMAVNEELGKAKAPFAPVREMLPDEESVEEMEAEEYDPPMPGLDAQLIEPPPPAEKALMELLSANPGDEAIVRVLRELLPDQVFAHDFTRRFVESYLEPGREGFAKPLNEIEDKWYTAIMLDAEIGNSSTQPVNKQIQDRARDIWKDRLQRLKNNETDPRKQLDLSFKIKQIQGLSWPRFKEFAKGMLQND
jgi:DNA primase